MIVLDLLFDVAMLVALVVVVALGTWWGWKHFHREIERTVKVVQAERLPPMPPYERVIEQTAIRAEQHSWEQAFAAVAGHDLPDSARYDSLHPEQRASTARSGSNFLMSGYFYQPPKQKVWEFRQLMATKEADEIDTRRYV